MAQHPAVASTAGLAHNRAPSQVFQLELEEDQCSLAAAADLPVSRLLAEAERAATETPAQRKLFYDAREAHALAQLNTGGEVSLESFAQLLALRGHVVWLRTGRPDCATGSGSTPGHVALRHRFVLAAVPTTASDATNVATAAGGAAAGGAATQQQQSQQQQLFVVDPAFRDSFQLPNATPTYAALWEALPSLFVGTAEQLVPLVHLMCEQMQAVFAEASASCPPWRTAACMLTKWLPSAADDVPVVPHCATERDSSATSTRTLGGSSSATTPTANCGAGCTTADDGLLLELPGVALLPPIRTGGAAAAAAGSGDEGAGPLPTPHSAHPPSPLYYEHDEHAQLLSSSKAAATGLLSPGARDAGGGGTQASDLLAAHYPPQGGSFGSLTAPLPRWRGGQAAFVHNNSSGDGLCFVGCVASSGGGGGGYASTCSSPGVEVLTALGGSSNGGAGGGLLCSFFSEDGSSSTAAGGYRTQGAGGRHAPVAIAAAQGLLRDALRQGAAACSPRDAGSKLAQASAAGAAPCSSKTLQQQQPQRSGSSSSTDGHAKGAARCWQPPPVDVTLDLSRFDAPEEDASADDALLPPLFFAATHHHSQHLPQHPATTTTNNSNSNQPAGGISSSMARLALSSATAAAAGAGAGGGTGAGGGGVPGKLPAPVLVRQRSTGGVPGSSSQCSALSAAIAGGRGLLPGVRR